MEKLQPVVVDRTYCYPQAEEGDGGILVYENEKLLSMKIEDELVRRGGGFFCGKKRVLGVKGRERIS